MFITFLRPRCVDKFCDPRSMSDADVTDLMICAPWDTEIFSCLADGKDHSPCCAARQIPPICQVKTILNLYVYVYIYIYTLEHV